MPEYLPDFRPYDVKALHAYISSVRRAVRAEGIGIESVSAYGVERTGT